MLVYSARAAPVQTLRVVEHAAKLARQAEACADLAEPRDELRRPRREVGIERRHVHDAALRGDGIELGVRQIARLVDERAHGGVARDDGRTRELERLHDGARGELRHVDDDAELVEPPHRGAAELRQAAVRLVAWNGGSRRIGKRVVARVIECEHAHAGLDVVVDQSSSPCRARMRSGSR